MMKKFAKAIQSESEEWPQVMAAPEMLKAMLEALRLRCGKTLSFSGNILAHGHVQLEMNHFCLLVPWSFWSFKGLAQISHPAQNSWKNMSLTASRQVSCVQESRTRRRGNISP